MDDTDRKEEEREGIGSWKTEEQPIQKREKKGLPDE
jgi:hypothetical protein